MIVCYFMQFVLLSWMSGCSDDVIIIIDLTILQRCHDFHKLTQETQDSLPGKKIDMCVSWECRMRQIQHKHVLLRHLNIWPDVIPWLSLRALPPFTYICDSYAHLCATENWEIYDAGMSTNIYMYMNGGILNCEFTLTKVISWRTWRKEYFGKIYKT